VQAPAQYQNVLELLWTPFLLEPMVLHGLDAWISEIRLQGLKVEGL
jgi:hypothetical protein